MRPANSNNMDNQWNVQNGGFNGYPPQQMQQQQQQQMGIAMVNVPTTIPISNLNLQQPKQINNNIMPIIGGGNIMQPVLQNTVIDNNISNFGPDSEINYNNKF